MKAKARTRTAEFRRLIACRVTATEWGAMELLMQKTNSDITGVLRAGLQCLAAKHGVYWPGASTADEPTEAAS